MNTLNKHRLADWSKAPEWATLHAVDANGKGYWYGGGTFPSEQDAVWKIRDTTGLLSSKFDLTGIDWRETLESRSDPELDIIREENARLHERLNRLTLDRINDEERHDPI